MSPSRFFIAILTPACLVAGFACGGVEEDSGEVSNNSTTGESNDTSSGTTGNNGTTSENNGTTSENNGTSSGTTGNGTTSTSNQTTSTTTSNGSVSCVSDADCDDGLVCEPGDASCDVPTCVAGCHEDSQCGAGETCNRVECVTCPCPGQCEAIGTDAECGTDADCGDGQVCEMGGRDCDTPVCVTGCHENRQCGEGRVCNQVDCVTCPCPGNCSDIGPDPECRSDADCGDGQVCELGGPACDTPVCVQGCHENRQCGEGRVCGRVECVTCPCPGNCAEIGPDPECRSDADCRDGLVCELGGRGCDTPTCVQGCHNNQQCGAGQICEEVVCVTCPCPGNCADVGPDPECRTDADCGDGLVCELGGRGCDTPTCVRGCHEDSQCGADEVCNQVECVTCPCPGICGAVGPEPECRSDADCGDGLVCELGGRGCNTPVCVPGCHEDSQCGENSRCDRVECLTCPCPGNCSDIGPDPECRTDADCRDGQVCELGGRGCNTPVCVTGCHENSQCGADEACNQVECITCPCPGICGAVGPDPGCRTDADCRDGQVCEPSGPRCGALTCVPGCHEDSQCGADEACNQVECVTCPCPGICGAVGPEPECRTDADCRDGLVCELGGRGCDTPVCVRGCHEDSQCGENRCNEVVCITCPCPGQCDAIDPVCRTDADCGVGLVCELGGRGCDTPTCVRGCHEDSQCGAGEACNRVECITCPCPGICGAVEPEPGCRSDADCGVGLVCELGGRGCDTPVCVAGCRENGDCTRNELCVQVDCVTCPCPALCQGQ